MSDAKAAMDRLTRWKAIDDHDLTTPHEYRDGEAFHEERLISDLKVVADAHLAEHRHDETALTEQVLRASGFGVREDEFGDPALHHYASGLSLRPSPEEGEWELCTEYVDGFLGVGCNVKTVGDLQRLLDALRIDCRIVVPGEEQHG